MRRQLPLFLFLFLASIVVLRFQLIHDLHIAMPLAWASGLISGLVFDIAVTFLAVGLGGIFFLVSPWAGRAAVSAFFFVTWTLTLGNLLHLKFFHSPLEVWTIRYHLSDISELGGSIQSLGFSFGTLASLVLATAAAVSLWRYSLVGSSRRRIGAVVLVWLALGLAFKQTPVWMQWTSTGDQHRGSFLNTHPVLRFYRDLKKGGLSAQTPTGGGRTSVSPEKKNEIQAVLRAFQGPAPAENLEATASARRAFLGLPPSGPLKIFLVYVESWRAYEYFHPELTTEIFSRTRDYFKKHALLYRQFYSSSALAGQTVRAQFSILCSLYPDVYGPATYIANPTIPLTCLPQVLADGGWTTTAMGTSDASFHNKALFDSTHGFQHVIYNKQFAERGLKERVGPWGFADGVFLQEGIRIQREAQAENEFAAMMTISSHHPFHIVPEGPLPERMRSWAQSHAEYAGFLSVFKYIDGALVDFFETVFREPDGDRTLVVVVGDHGIPLASPYEQTEIQVKESEFRVPLAFVTKNMPKPREITSPAHQVDLAPTLVAIAGVKKAPFFLGRDLLAPERFAQPGSPWIYDELLGISYRQGETACYALKSAEGTRCFRVGLKQDPLFDRDLIAIAENPAQSQALRTVLRSVQEGLAAQLLK